MKIKKYKGVVPKWAINHVPVTYYYVGETADIKAIYKSIIRHSDKHNIEPEFEEEPEFQNNNEIYGLCIQYTKYNENYIAFVDSDTMLYMICAGEVEEV